MFASSISDMAVKRRKTHQNKNLTRSTLFGMIAVAIVFSGCTMVGPDYVKHTAHQSLKSTSLLAILGSDDSSHCVGSWAVGLT